LFGELAELSVSRPISLDPPMLSLVCPMISLFRPMLSRGRPAPFSAERVVVQGLNLVFGTRKSAQKESATTGQKLFSYQQWIRFVLVDEENGRLMYVKRNLMLLRL
jgi:hypothetical protein